MWEFSGVPGLNEKKERINFILKTLNDKIIG